MWRATRRWLSEAVPPAAAKSFRRQRQQVAPMTSKGNPHGKLHKVKHWKMLSMVCFSGIAGYMAGKMIDINEDEVCKPLFDKKEIQDQLRKCYEFRPDLAATTLRAALLLASRRGGVTSEFVGESCAVDGGLDDIANVLQTQTILNGISTEDLVALAAIEAVRFLRGPADDIAFHWGREDVQDVEGVKQYAEENQPKPGEVLVYNQTRGKKYDERQCPVLKRTMAEFLSGLHPDLSDEEMVALMACHGVGEYHVDVSGLDEFPNRLAVTKAQKHTLDNHYFQMLLELEKDWVKYEVPRTLNNRKKPLPQMMKAHKTYVSPKDGKTKKKMIVATEREVKELLFMNPEWRKAVEDFAKDNDRFRSVFASGFTKVLEGHYSNRLRTYTARSQFTDERRAENEKHRLEQEERKLQSSKVLSEEEIAASDTGSASGVKKQRLSLRPTTAVKKSADE